MPGPARSVDASDGGAATSTDGAAPALVLREASGAERTVPLDSVERAPLVIGRDPDCDIRIDSPYVSRQHARIEARDDDLALVDLGSRNGSSVNGTRVAGEVLLTDGDTIAIGDATLRCRFTPRPSEPTRTLEYHGAQPVAPSTQDVSADTLQVDASTYEVSVGSQPLTRRLSAQEFQLLSYLYEQRQRVCTRQELGDSIWGKNNWDPNMLHRLVHRLKEKLEPQPDKPRYVQTVPWVGYRLTP